MEHGLRTLSLLDPAQIPAEQTDLPLPDAATLAAERPDEIWIVEDRRDGITACGSLWWRDTPFLDGRKVGYIGHYAASCRDAARLLLDHATQRLAAEGCGVAVAPVNGSTWRSYRVVTEDTGAAPFMLEPRNPPEWVADVQAAGFAPCATYQSTVNDALDVRDPRLPDIERHVAAQGITFRGLDPSRLEEELRAIHALALESFRRNFLFTEIGLDDFMGLYGRLLDIVPPDCVLLAEQAGRLAGFAFAVQDHAQAMRGGTIDTLILKTLAVRPGRAFAGLGRLLIGKIHEVARSGGYSKIVYALMHDGNASRAYCQRYSSPLRRYAVFARRLS
jgi:GNAT superfamily N-acetyltransferase